MGLGFQLGSLVNDGVEWLRDTRKASVTWHLTFAEYPEVTHGCNGFQTWSVVFEMYYLMGRQGRPWENWNTVNIGMLEVPVSWKPVQ